MTDEIQAKVLEVFREALSIEPPSPDTDMIGSARLDSLSLVTLVIELEECFSIAIPFESLDIDAFRTVQSIAQVVETQVRARSFERVRS